MRTIISRWFLFGLLVGWALTHATVFAQPAAKSTDKTATAADKLRANLDKNVTLDFTGNSLTEVLNHFREKTGIAINIDQVAMMQMGDFGGGIPGAPNPPVQVKAANEKASQVLRKLLNAHNLTYVIFDDAVLVSTEEGALSRQMRQRVSVDLEDVPFNKAARSLARNHGINLVIDPTVAAKADTKVSLQLDNTGIETTVRLLAELANLKAVRMGNVLFITTEEKAKKIRKEEATPLDNPFNPNIPMFRGGMLGGFGGAMPAMPAGGVAGVPIPVQKLLPQGPPNDIGPRGILPGNPPPKGGLPQLPPRPAVKEPIPQPPRPPQPEVEPPVIQRPVDPSNPAPRQQPIEK